MQSIISRRSASAFRTSPARVSSILSPRTPLQARRTYAGEAHNEAKGNTTRIPLMVAGLVAVFLPLYYFSQGTQGVGKKPQGSGQATIKEIRREKGTEGEHRDPRDSSVKTLGQKEGGEGRGAGK